MKKMLMLFWFCFVSGILISQNGIITLKRSTEIYYGQWYVYKKWSNTLFLYETSDRVNEILTELLDKEGLHIEDATIRENGDLLLHTETYLGFEIQYIRMSLNHNKSLLLIRTGEMNNRTRTGEPWYAFLLRRGRLRFEPETYL